MKSEAGIDFVVTGSSFGARGFVISILPGCSVGTIMTPSKMPSKKFSKSSLGGDVPCLV